METKESKIIENLTSEINELEKIKDAASSLVDKKTWELQEYNAYLKGKYSD